MWVCEACEALYETRALTRGGERFVAGILAAAQDSAAHDSAAQDQAGEQ
jgi:hypothetical protein